MVFRRGRATPLVVHAKAHEKLKGYLTGVVEVRATVLEAMRRDNAAGAYAARTKTRKLKVDSQSTLPEMTTLGSSAASSAPAVSAAQIQEVVNSVRERMVSQQVPMGSTAWACRESAAKSVARTLAAFVALRRPLVLEDADGLPGAVSVRLALGVNHAERVVWGAPPSEAWVSLGDLSWATPSSQRAKWTLTKDAQAFPAGVEGAAYAEVAHIDQTWCARFIFVELAASAEGK